MGNSYAGARAKLEKARKDLAKQAKGMAKADPDLAKMLIDEADEHAKVIGKLDAGRYNVCDGCGGTISGERLAEMPAVLLCVDCAEGKKPKSKTAATAKRVAPSAPAAKSAKKPAKQSAKKSASDSELKVWVDSDICSGSGRCAKAVPDLFAVGKGGACYLKAGKKLVGGPDKLVDVPAALEKRVTAAAKKCPDQCVFVEV